MTATATTTTTAAATIDADGSWSLRVDDTGARAGALLVGQAGQQARLHEGDCLYRRTVVNSRQGERFVEYRRRRVTEFVQRGGTWFVDFADDYDLGHPRRRLEEVLRSVATGRPPESDTHDATWSQTSPDGFDVHDESGTWRTWERVRDHEATPATDLEFQQISGAGSQTTVNEFLEGGRDGRVDHALGGVHAWKAGFVARDSQGRIQSACVGYFYHPSQNGEELCITRLANHPDAPENTSSWMLANVREWAADNGYESIATYAGVGANEGICYEAAGFRQEGDPVERDGATWETDDDTGTGAWLRQKWVCDLEGTRT